LSLSVHGSGTGDAFDLDVEPADAVEACRHPYAYAAGHGVSFNGHLEADGS
jgi:hypothetical protein